MLEEKIKVFISSRFTEFKPLRELIIEQKFHREDIEIIALEDREFTTYQSPKLASIEYAQESDIYILFVGETYGGCPQNSNKSYTHLEYTAAIERNMAKIIFLFGDEYKNYGDISKVTCPNIRNWVKEIYDEDDAPIIKSFKTDYTIEDVYKTIRESLNSTTTNLTKKGLKSLSPSHKKIYYDEKLLITNIIEFLHNKDEIELLQQTVLKYFPVNYTEPIPSSINDIIELLISYGSFNNNIPIICIFQELNKLYNYPTDFKTYLNYLTEVKFKDIKYQCKENNLVKERSFLIEFLKQENNEYSIQVWEYLNNECTQNNLFLPKSINLNNQGIKSFFDELFHFFNNIRYKGIEIYLEIILPIEQLSKGIKSWNYSGKYKEKKVISKYKYVLRIQERFRNLDIQWETKWNNINYGYSLLENPYILLNSEYNDDISEVNTCVLSQSKVEDVENILCDIDENNISIALLQLSENIDKDEYKILCNEIIKNCRNNIGHFICSNHNNENSNMIFLLDDPNKIPEQFKKNVEYQYGFD